MSLVIDLPQYVEQRLEIEAAKAGVSKTEYAARLVIQSLPVDRESATEARLHALSQWFALPRPQNPPLLDDSRAVLYGDEDGERWHTCSIPISLAVTNAITRHRTHRCLALTAAYGSDRIRVGASPTPTNIRLTPPLPS